MRITSLALIGIAALATGQAAAQSPETQAPMIRENAAQKVADHTWVILDNNVGFVPNVGIVVGERATLIVDTGLGDRNGAIVLAEARKLSDNTEFFLVATHFHPEHDLGANAFPDDATMVRWRGQQAENEQFGAETIERFRGFSPAVADLLDGVSFRPADLLFEESTTIDLGGVQVRATGVGPNHTLGDTVVYVEQDDVLFTGDVVMSVFPSVSAQSGSIAKWLANLDAFEALTPAIVVPAHGRLGDVALIRRYREYLTAVQSASGEAKRNGTSIETAQPQIAATLARDFADLQPANGNAGGRINAAIQAAYREAPAPSR